MSIGKSALGTVCNTYSSGETSLSGFDVAAAVVVGCEYG